MTIDHQADTSPQFGGIIGLALEDDTQTFWFGGDEFTIVNWQGRGATVLVTQADGQTSEIIVDVATYQAAKAIDAWLIKTYPDDPNRGFPGLRLEIYDHETGWIENKVYKMPGLLAVQLGKMDFSVDELVDWAEYNGDRVLRVADLNGVVLYDEKEAKLSALKANLANPGTP